MQYHEYVGVSIFICKTGLCVGLGTLWSFSCYVYTNRSTRRQSHNKCLSCHGYKRVLVAVGIMSVSFFMVTTEVRVVVGENRRRVVVKVITNRARVFMVTKEWVQYR